MPLRIHTEEMYNVAKLYWRLSTNSNVALIAHLLLLRLDLIRQNLMQHDLRLVRRDGASVAL